MKARFMLAAMAALTMVGCDGKKDDKKEPKKEMKAQDKAPASQVAPASA